MCETTSDIREDLFDALAQLRSTDQGSAEKLREMLDARIEKKYGLRKTLAARMPKQFLQNIESALPIRDSKEHDCRLAETCNVVKTENWNGDPEVISFLEIDELDNFENHRISDLKVLEAEYEDCREEEQDIPRISIPDQEFVNGTLCKLTSEGGVGNVGRAAQFRSDARWRCTRYVTFSFRSTFSTHETTKRCTKR
ncbi:hypothetical protein PUN28_012440 [Cardiocondyla obscurior]|uniref:Uncharacterized protein n=1 Tax=Cardiocondyla obscurior TaxID=286306 RepID=A0AAW2FFX4_9HYME